jgi:cyclopropane-fatty-acyl-phospholipid synthase
MMKATLYHGQIQHTRQDPAWHSFSYPAFFCGFDLGDLPSLNARWPLAGFNRAAVLSVYDGDYLGDSPGGILAKWQRLLTGRAVAERIVRVELITVPRLLGYGYHPVNFYLGYGADEALACSVAEINNTYGETHLYVMDQPMRTRPGIQAEFRATKEFFVSPFFDLRGEYLFQFRRTAKEIDIRVVLHRQGRVVLDARLWGRSHPFSRAAIVSTLFRYPLAAVLTMPRIAWQARRLKAKGLPALLKPEPVSPMTIRRVPRESPSPRD